VCPLLIDRDKATLREIYNRLREAYSDTIGVEYMHIPDAERCNWIRERVCVPSIQWA